jgi:hypothetical protein
MEKLQDLKEQNPIGFLDASLLDDIAADRAYG